uniref:Hydroxyproline-rich glycoprotein family protein n=1 Tax=Opuntia streptacantha TaxID=393608 RepID=A0A7C8ZUI6_OPUST
MESPTEYSPVPRYHSDASRPSLGFPLGTALLLIVIFSLSGIFSCCYHWDKFRSLRRQSQSQSQNHSLDLEAAHHPDSDLLKEKEKQQQQQAQMRESVPVIMPGDEMPRFIALPCPCEPLRPEKLIPPPLPQKPPKSPRFPVPLY